jgi:uncharacterized repeat protein (TIGR03803 family)
MNTAYGKQGRDRSGNIYSTTRWGGTDDYGTVFRLSPNANGSWTKSVSHSFTGEDGIGPVGSLIFDQSGSLYGTTSAGGVYGWGMVYKLTPKENGSWEESALHSFNADGTDGYFPFSGVISDAEGSLYGTTIQGGPYDCGAVFRLSPNEDGSWTETVLHAFNCDDGESPFATLTFDRAGNLYGTTNTGGPTNYGVAFQLSPNEDGSWTESTLHFFNRDGRDGFFPIPALRSILQEVSMEQRIAPTNSPCQTIHSGCNSPEV